mmetsp:Transcript_19509/g.42399  ORF Transcript_19509/g.42399 Transcript_19509/m.42399 type:complete len:369 (+) Transcript_19509:1318-2424(+)
MNVILSVCGKVKVDDQGNLLHIDTTRQQIGCDQHTGGPGAEFSHNDVALPLVHVSVHAGNGEIPFLHLFLQPIDLAPGVAVDNGLRDGEGLVEIAQGFELPLLSVHGNVKLLDTLQGQLVLLDKNANGFAHEPIRNLQDVQGHGGGEQADLDLFGEELEDVVDLLLEATGKHLIGLVQKELLHGVQSEGAPGDHVVDTSGGSDHHVHTVLEGADVVADGGTSDTGVDLDVHVVTEGQDDLLNLARQLTSWGQDQGLALLDLLIDHGETTDRECCGFTGTGLGLGDQVPSRNCGSDGTLLDGRGFLETVRVNTTEEFLGKLHAIKGFDDLVPVGRNVGVGQLAGSAIFAIRGGIGWWGFAWVVCHSNFC